jgi:hypothetical protein
MRDHPAAVRLIRGNLDDRVGGAAEQHQTACRWQQQGHTQPQHTGVREQDETHAKARGGGDRRRSQPALVYARQAVSAKERADANRRHERAITRGSAMQDIAGKRRQHRQIRRAEHGRDSHEHQRDADARRAQGVTVAEQNIVQRMAGTAPCALREFHQQQAGEHRPKRHRIQGEARSFAHQRNQAACN